MRGILTGIHRFRKEVMFDEGDEDDDNDDDEEIDSFLLLL